MQQKRLILALVLSSAILFLWSYFYPAKPPQNNQASATPSPTATQGQPGKDTSPPVGSSSPATPPLATNPNAAPQRTVTIRTPLYVAKFESRGAEPVSWVLLRNSHSQAEIFSVAGKKSDRRALELVSPEGLTRQPRLVPLQVQTGDAAIDSLLSATTYRVEGIDQNAGTDVEVNLLAGEKKQLTFALDDPNGLQVRKTLTFDADHYTTDLSLTVKRGDQVVPQVKVTIGPSISDQGVTHHTFYSVAPEAISFAGGKVERHPAANINSNKNSPDKLVLPGPVD